MQRRPGWVIVRRSFVGIAAVLAAVAAAWLASNWNDAPPTPRPAALALPAPQVDDASNAFFALIGLRAAAERDVVQAGRAIWQKELDAAAARALRPAAIPVHRSPDADATGIAQFSGTPPLFCTDLTDACATAWVQAGAALAAQRAPHALLGSRCEAMLDKGFRFEERLGPMRSAMEPFASHAQNAVNCSRWLLSGAVLAWTKGDSAQAVAMFEKADRLNRGLLAASHTLIAQMIAIRTTRNTFHAITAVAVRDAALAERLAPFVAPLPDGAAAVRRWAAAEAALGRGLVDAMSRNEAQADYEWTVTHQSAGTRNESMRRTTRGGCN